MTGKLADIAAVALGVALVTTIAAIVVVVIVAGADAIAATGLRDLAILLGGALAGLAGAKSLK